MKAGRMTETLEVFRPEATTNQFGEEVVNWVREGMWHCERVSFTGRSHIEAGEQFPDYTIRVNINYAHKPQEHWQVNFEGNRYEVVLIEPNRRRGMRTLTLERINP